MPPNSQFTVAIHILSLLEYEQRPLSSSYIGESVVTNPAFIRRIVAQLHEAGLVETIRGVNGGVTLAREASEITLLDVHRAVSDEFDLFALHHGSPNPKCPCGANIQPVLMDVFADIHETVANRLQQTTIAAVTADIKERAT